MLDLKLHVTLHGCSKADIYSHRGQSVAVFKNVKVDRRKRRKGYGNELLTTLENIARALGYDSCVLWTDRSAWMHDWYNAGGMKIMPIMMNRLLCGCGNRYEKLKTE